jgi:hypothetical protein
VFLDDFSCLVTGVIEVFFVASSDDSGGEFHSSPGQRPGLGSNNELKPCKVVTYRWLQELRRKRQVSRLLMLHKHGAGDFSDRLLDILPMLQVAAPGKTDTCVLIKDHAFILRSRAMKKK